MNLEMQLLVLEFSRAIKDVLIVYVWFLEKVQTCHWRKFVQLLIIIIFVVSLCIHIGSLPNLKILTMELIKQSVVGPKDCTLLLLKLIWTVYTVEVIWIKLYVLLLSLGEEVSEEEEIRGRVSVREIKLKEWVREALAHSFTHSPHAFPLSPISLIFSPSLSPLTPHPLSPI